MKKDRHPENNTELASPPDYHRDPPEEDATPSLMAYPSLETLQQRLDTFEDRFADNNQQDDRTLAPRIARVAPMSAAAESTGDRQPPDVEVAASAATSVAAATATTSDAASFAAAATSDAASFAAAAYAAAVAAAAGNGPAGAARTVGVRSAVRATGWDTPYSAADASATSNTTTYASPRGRFITNYTRPMETFEQPYLLCVASTSRNYCRYDSTAFMPPYAYGSYTDSYLSSANRSAETIAAASNLNPEAPIFHPRFHDAGKPNVLAPRKVAKRSEQHTSVKSTDDMVADHRSDDDEDMDVDI